MSLADSSQGKLSRFRILELLSDSLFGLTCAGLAKRAGQKHWDTRSGRASLATRLRRLRTLGLVQFELDKSSRPARSRPDGIRRWRVSQRGIARLEWAKQQKKL